MYGMPSGFDDRLHPRTFEGRQRHYLSDSISVSSGSMDEITGPPTRRLVIGLKVSRGMNEDANLFTRSFSRRARWRAIIKFNHPSPRAGGGKIYNSPCSCMSFMRHGSALHSESKHTRQPHPIALMKLFIGRFSCWGRRANEQKKLSRRTIFVDMRSLLSAGDSFERDLNSQTIPRNRWVNLVGPGKWGRERITRDHLVTRTISSSTHSTSSLKGNYGVSN